MAVGGLGVSGGPIKALTLLLISGARRSAACLLRSARGARGPVSCGEALLAHLLRAPPRCGVPDLDVVVEADDHHVPLEAGELAQALWDGHAALAVRAGFHGAREERPLDVAVALAGPVLDLGGLHVELLGAPEGEAAILVHGDVRQPARRLAEACWDAESAFGVDRG